ncbi:MAG TPA: sulfocyanin-like copper-binding protein [Thermomicrobiaceae bacterium]|nr:sulfocyanin-like copper-binding protein [Thermomicrobiaceae bacterium]
MISSASPTANPNLAGILHVDDPSGQVVTLDFQLASGPSLNGFNINGLGKGRLQIAVPVTWTVHVNCQNEGLQHHSCAIIQGTQTDQLAFPGASTPSPLLGMARGESNSFTFTPDRVGSFRLTCLVPGHMEAGMWASFEVTAAGSPTVDAV